MNYRNHYNLLMQKAKTRNVLTCYTEMHHIVPKSEGGLDDPSNVVKLTAREHFIAHWLLYREDPSKGSRAHSFWRMCNGRGKVSHKNWIIISSRSYEEARYAHSVAISKALKGKKKSKEHVDKVAKANTGKKRTVESKLKMSESAKRRGRPAGYEAMAVERDRRVDSLKKAVCKVDVNTNQPISEYKSLREAAESVNRSPANICIALKTNKTCAGYRWIYKL